MLKASHLSDNEHTVCQVAVSLSAANDHASLPIAYRLSPVSAA
jgi:hypothetical protein